jgi:shikimate kinase
VAVALVGHRAAGKTRVLPHVSKLLGREGFDLDAELQRRSGRDLGAWVRDDEPSFRAAERECFDSFPPGSLVACGGGFLSHHPMALAGCLAVLVPVTFETYFERLKADTARPRLRPSLALDEELRELWAEREEKHRRVFTVSLVDLALMAAGGQRPRRVVTLPPGVDPRNFAFGARRSGAELLEIRTDLIPRETSLDEAARVLPLLVAERQGPEVPARWRELAQVIDVEAPRDGARVLRSFHSPEPLSPEQALAFWSSSPPGTRVKHVEPLGPVENGWRLLETQRLLIERFGPEAVTVLATGALALPFRAVLAGLNALDYLALEPGFSAAAGQRLLADAVREARAGMPAGPRLGIIGHQIVHSRSPSIHPQPFDRIDLLADVEVGPLLEALRSQYRGFAVTRPFKKNALKGKAVNTLVRKCDHYEGENADVPGARAALEKLGGMAFDVLGEGGVSDALAAAAIELGLPMRFIRRAEVGGKVLEKSVVWTWPPEIDPPEGLRLDGKRVGVISYGLPGHRIAEKVRALGGTVVWLGARWFVAQARAQRAKWLEAT